MRIKKAGLKQVRDKVLRAKKIVTNVMNAELRWVRIVTNALLTGVTEVMNAVLTGVMGVRNAVLTGVRIVTNAVLKGVTDAMNALLTGVMGVMNEVLMGVRIVRMVMNAVLKGVTDAMNAVLKGVMGVRNAVLTCVTHWTYVVLLHVANMVLILVPVASPWRVVGSSPLSAFRFIAVRVFSLFIVQFLVFTSHILFLFSFDCLFSLVSVLSSKNQMPL